MKKKKRFGILSYDLHHEKCPTVIVNIVNNGSSVISMKGKAKHTVEQAESNCLTKPTVMNNFTFSNDVSSRNHIESSEEKVSCFTNGKSDAPKISEKAYPAVSMQSEERCKHRSRVRHKKLKQQSCDSKTDSSKTEAYSNIVSCGQEQERTHSLSSIAHREDRNIYANCQRIDQSSGGTYRFKQRRRKQTGNTLATKHESNVCSNDDSELKQPAQTGAITLNKPIFQMPRKLLILDLNGILVDIQHIQNADQFYAEREHINVSQKTAFKRPFCHDFLDFCFNVFDIGIWSSRMKHNVEVVVDYLMGNRKKKLLFCWDNTKCTHTGFDTVEKRKPLVLKELRKLWDKEDPDLPWGKGTYSPSNTLLIDDSPCKALCNPSFTGIFPWPYSFRDENDNSLGQGGDIRVFLEGLAKADNVQDYVEKNPIGQRTITDRDPSWKFYLQVIKRVEKKNKRNA